VAKISKKTKKTKSSEPERVGPKNRLVNAKAKAKALEEAKVAEKAPFVEEGAINVSFLPNDLSVFSNFMNECSKMLETQALQALEQKNEALFNLLSQQHRISILFAARLAAFSNIGEPSSRELH
jgi:hypothetical protein